MNGPHVAQSHPQNSAYLGKVSLKKELSMLNYIRIDSWVRS